MSRALSAQRFLVLATLIASSSAAASASEAEGELDGIDFKAMQTEIEIETRIIEDNGELAYQLNLEAERSTSERVAVGARLKLEREAGEASTLDSALVRLKWRAPRHRSGASFAVQAGVGYSFANDAPLTETQAYIGWKGSGWSAVGRFDVEQLLQAGAEPELGYRLQVARDLGPGIRLGGEAAGDVWTGVPTRHRLGPYLQLPLGGETAPTLELGAFAGLSSVSPDMIYRVELEFKF
jgi:hypothetical protein